MSVGGVVDMIEGAAESCFSSDCGGELIGIWVEIGDASMWRRERKRFMSVQDICDWCSSRLWFEAQFVAGLTRFNLGTGFHNRGSMKNIGTRRGGILTPTIAFKLIYFMKYTSSASFFNIYLYYY